MLAFLRGALGVTFASIVIMWPSVGYRVLRHFRG
jgi:hypothetical protein